MTDKFRITCKLVNLTCELIEDMTPEEGRRLIEDICLFLQGKRERLEARASV